MKCAWVVLACGAMAGCQAAPDQIEGPLSEASDAELMRSYASSSQHESLHGADAELATYLGDLRTEYLINRVHKLGWREDVRQDVLQGRVRDGMTMDMVVFSWGGPWTTSGVESSPAGDIERWQWGWASAYHGAWREATFTDGVLVWWTERPNARPPW